MALLKYVMWWDKPTNSSFYLQGHQVEEANKAVAKVLEWKMVQQVLRNIFKMEHQHKWINCKKTEYLEKLKEVLKSKSGDKKSPCAYPYV